MVSTRRSNTNKPSKSKENLVLFHSCCLLAARDVSDGNGKPGIDEVLLPIQHRLVMRIMFSGLEKSVVVVVHKT